MISFGSQQTSLADREILRAAAAVNRACLLTAGVLRETPMSPKARESLLAVCSYIDGNEDPGPGPGRWSRQYALLLIRHAAKLMELDLQHGTTGEREHHQLLSSLMELTLRVLELECRKGSGRVLDRMVQGRQRP